MVKNLNFNFWILLLALVVFFSSSSIVYAEPSDTSGSSSTSTESSGPTHSGSSSSSLPYIEFIQNVQTGKSINSSATNYLMFKYRGLYYIHISENEFSLGSFTYNLIKRTGVKTSGWWLVCDYASTNASDWQFIPWSNDNYSMLYYDTNYITYDSEIVVNFTLDKENIVILYSTQTLDNFFTEGVNNADVTIGGGSGTDTDTDTDTDVDYSEDHQTIIDKISDIPNSIIEGIKGLFVPSDDYFSNKLKSIESKYVSILGFSVDDFEAMLIGFANETPIKDVYYTLNVGSFSKEVKVLDASIIDKGITHFRPYIRGFVVLLMVFFSMNQLMHLFKINSISGSSNDTDKK